MPNYSKVDLKVVEFFVRKPYLELPRKLQERTKIKVDAKVRPDHQVWQTVTVEPLLYRPVDTSLLLTLL